MSELTVPHSEERPPRRPAALVVMAILLFLEGVALSLLTVVLAIDAVAGRSSTFAAGIAVTAVAARIAAGVVAIAVGAYRGRPWIRGATVTVQVLTIVVAIGSLQGTFARPEPAWLMLTPAIAILVLLFSRPVIAATTRTEESP